MFEYIETGIERVMDEEQYFTNELRSIRQNTFLQGILEGYIQLFSNNGSIISLTFPEINRIKMVMVNIVTILYSNYQCPLKIFKAVYLTFLL